MIFIFGPTLEHNHQHFLNLEPTVYNYFTIVILNPKRFYNKWKNKEVLYFTSFYISDNSKIALRTGWNEAKDQMWSKSQKFILWNQQYSRKNKQEERKSYKETERETVFLHFHFYEFYSGSQHLSHGNNVENETILILQIIYCSIKILVNTSSESKEKQIENVLYVKESIFLFLPNFMQSKNDENIVLEDLWTWRS